MGGQKRMSPCSHIQLLDHLQLCRPNIRYNTKTFDTPLSNPPSQWTQVFVTLDFTLYISYKTTIFFIVKSFLNGFLIIFAPEEAEIFQDYLFILA